MLTSIAILVLFAAAIYFAMWPYAKLNLIEPDMRILLQRGEELGWITYRQGFNNRRFTFVKTSAGGVPIIGLIQGDLVPSESEQSLLEHYKLQHELKSCSIRFRGIDEELILLGNSPATIKAHAISIAEDVILLPSSTRFHTVRGGIDYSVRR